MHKAVRVTPKRQMSEILETGNGPNEVTAGEYSKTQERGHVG